MPIYEYRCEKCGNEFEEMQKFSDPCIEVCQACGGKTHKLISHSSFILKGTGWYVTDYGKGGSSCKATPPKKEPATEAKSSDTTSSKD
jgi:putative FmdB family regulatory protein